MLIVIRNVTFDHVSDCPMCAVYTSLTKRTLMLVGHRSRNMTSVLEGLRGQGQGPFESLVFWKSSRRSTDLPSSLSALCVDSPVLEIYSPSVYVIV